MGNQMPWFKHQHYWRQKTGINPIRRSDKELAEGGVILEDCPCGAVRMVEFRPGEVPKVFITEAPND